MGLSKQDKREILEMVGLTVPLGLEPIERTGDLNAGESLEDAVRSLMEHLENYCDFPSGAAEEKLSRRIYAALGDEQTAAKEEEPAWCGACDSKPCACYV